MFGVAMNPERPAAATLTVCGGETRTEPLNTELVVRLLDILYFSEPSNVSFLGP